MTARIAGSASSDRSARAAWRDRTAVWLAACAGMLAYWRHPRRRRGEPFNGQQFRRRLFLELCERVPFVAIIETGTHQGLTTRYFRRSTSLPIHSFEADPRRYGFARAQLMFLPDLHVHLCDSRAGLAALARLNALPPGPVFFYLDAHWFGDLPLADEIHLAFRQWPEAVLMIDDFAVPDDPGYGFDDYGRGEALTLDYLAANRALPSGVWFPRCASGAETGARRGCVVLASAADVVRRIDAVTALRAWRPPD